MTRDDVLRKFGPKLLEGLVETLQEELNSIRAFIGMPNKDKESLLLGIKDKEKNIPDYDWMDEKIKIKGK